MSKSQQAIVDNTCKASVTNAIAEGEAMQFDVMANAKEHGVHIRYWNDTMLTAFEEKWDEVVAEKTVADPFFKKVWGDLSTFRKGYDLWVSNAFLPRATNK